MALRPRVPAAALDLEAMLSSVAPRDLMGSYARSMASGSSTSGTYSSTNYKSSRGSIVSCKPDPDVASQLSLIELSCRRLEVEDNEEKLRKIERVKRLVKEFSHGDGGIEAVVERWLSELGVSWVLGIADNASAGTSLLLRAQCILTEDWIRALDEITGSTLRFVREQRHVLAEQDMLGPVQLVFKETVLKMLPFVDALLAAADLLDAGTDTADGTNGAQAPPAEKLQTLLDVRDALFSASGNIQYSFQWWCSAVEMEAQGSSNEVLDLLSARLDKAVWNTMEEVRTSILNDKWGVQTLHGSTNIFKVTRSLVTYIEYLWGNYWRVDQIVRTAAELGSYCIPKQDKTDTLSKLTMDMVYSLQLKLDKRSESFPDQSHRLIFLINNTHFIWQHLHPLFLFRMKFHTEDLATKVEYYIQKYLQVSWEPVLSCLYNHTPRWFRKNSALPKFELEFQKTYTVQKFWKVPDPELRTRLRKAIVEKVVSGFTKYLDDNNITKPGITPREREKKLLELFEG